MRIDGTAWLARGLDLDTLLACLDGIVRVHALQHEIGVAIEVAIHRQRSRVLGQTGRQHVRQNARHDGRPQGVIEALEPLGHQARVHVVEEIVHVLYRKTEVFEPQFEGN